LVNAVLRRFLRERDALVAAAEASPTARWNHPLWWIEQMRRDWPGDWQALLTAANRRPPMTLRINRRRCSGAAYVQRLAAQGMAGQLLADPAFGGQAVVLDEPCAVQTLPGFADGDVSVQDAAAQRAALLLAQEGGLPSGARVLDACAAPGGKTAHLLELAELDLLALDSDGARLARVHDTLRRLQLSATIRQADAAQPQAWWDGRPFDAILLDAPCSASGIVRRHPDIRWLRRASDLPALAALQTRLLEALWPLLAPGGRLLYATCSLFRSEGQTQIDAFLQRRGAAAALLHPASPGHLPTLPDNPADAAEVVHDGFYLALILKT
jgi:16S rRNA (cytosine967-C5)-methyltransferase